MNAYEQKKALRIQRMREGAKKKLFAAGSARATFDRILSVIPPGQPILVGHHSEKRHRRDLAKVDRAMRKSIELQNDAETQERRADAAEEGRAISSDDPEAVAKLRARLAELEAMQAKMIAGNKAIRAKKSAAEVAKILGCSETRATMLLAPDCMGDVGFAPYKLTNNSGNMRRIRQRLAELEAKAVEAPRAPLEMAGATISEADNRVRIAWPSKPSPETCKLLKSRGFRWAPSLGVWQRHASESAWYDAKWVVGKVQ